MVKIPTLARARHKSEIHTPAIFGIHITPSEPHSDCMAFKRWHVTGHVRRHAARHQNDTINCKMSRALQHTSSLSIQET